MLAEELCPNSSANDVRDNEIRQCEERRRTLRGPLREQIQAANRQYQEVATRRSTMARERVSGGDCTDIVQAITTSNDAGRATMGGALNSLLQLKQELREQQDHFRAQIRKLEQSIRSNGNEFFLTQNAYPQLRLGQIKSEQSRALERDIAPLMAMLDLSIRGANESQVKLEELNASAENQRVACRDLGQIADATGAERPAPAPELQTTAGSPAPVTVRESIRDPLSGLDQTVPTRELMRSASYQDPQGARYFVSEQVTTNGSRIFWAVQEGTDGTQRAMPISQMEYERLSAVETTDPDSPYRLSNYSRYFADGSSATVRIGGSPLQAGNSGYYGAGGTTGTELHPQTGEAIGEISSEEIASRGALHQALIASVGAGEQPRTVVASGTSAGILAQDGRRLSAEQVAQVIANQRGSTLSSDQRQAVAQTLIEEANRRGGSFEERQEFIASRLARIQMESNFDPTQTSPVGARGLAQLMPGTAIGLANTPAGRAVIPEGWTVDRCLGDPVCNLRLSMVYDSQVTARHGENNPYLNTAYYLLGTNRQLASLSEARQYTSDNPAWMQAVGNAPPVVSNYVFGNYYYTDYYSRALGGSGLPLAGSIEARPQANRFSVGRNIVTTGVVGF